VEYIGLADDSAPSQLIGSFIAIIRNSRRGVTPQDPASGRSPPNPRSLPVYTNTYHILIEKLPPLAESSLMRPYCGTEGGFMAETSSSGKLIKLDLALEMGDDVDSEELDRATRHLRNAIDETGVESVELSAEQDVPEGAKAVDPVAIGSMLVSVLSATLPGLLAVLHSWVTVSGGRKVKLKVRAGRRSVDLEIPGRMTERELADLLRTITRTAG
jgi:hypothetical protein